MSRLESMQDVFTNQLKDVLSAEKQLLKALPKMAKGAKSSKLAEAFEHHLTETERQVERIEQIFEHLGKRAQAKHCHGMEGLIKEGDEALEAEGEDALVDTEIIAAAQRVEHYEIAAYGCLVEYSKLMGMDEVTGLLEESLEEEKSADRKLTEVNESEISANAMSAGMAGVGAESGGSMRSSSGSSGSSNGGSMRSSSGSSGSSGQSGSSQRAGASASTARSGAGSSSGKKSGK
jgi:ferritin-like metal-binding protein YciE